MSVRLDKIAANIRMGDPDLMLCPPRRRASMIAEHLRQRKLIGVQSDARYHDIQNNFIGSVLQGNHHQSLPLVSVAIYCCVGSRLGVDAHPCEFPGHVYTVIKLPAEGIDKGEFSLNYEAEQNIYMDPFRSSQEVNVRNLKAQLWAMGIHERDHVSMLGASSTSDIVHRCAMNIITSVRLHTRSNRRRPSSSLLCPINPASAYYATQWAIMLLPITSQELTFALQRARTLHFLWEGMEQEQFLLDIWLFEKHVLPLIEHPEQLRELRGNIDLVRSKDCSPKQVKSRTRETIEKVHFRIGQVFCHKRYHYQAVIIGWDIECKASIDWMTHMGVHNLSRGKHQSFYNVL